MSQRTLPKKRNPQLAADATPEHAELASRRRLGSTVLSVRPGQVGISNATKLKNLGVFEYAHLRAPLPDELNESEIFAPQVKNPKPHAYFLMRRSSDGFVSATGMFKASFPWAKKHEEEDERTYLKSFDVTSSDDVAGNVWVPERFALELAEEYGIRPWILALLDPSLVLPVTEDKPVSSPPPFVFTANDKAGLPSPAPAAKGRGRPKAGSPTKSAGKQASPRKRTTKAVKEANAAAARQASENLQAVLDTTAPSVTDSTADSERGDEQVVVNVKTAVEVNGGVETTHTNVKVKMPASGPDVPPVESTEEMIARAKEMVAEAAKLDGEVAAVAAPKKAGKRKAVEAAEDADEPEAKDAQSAKRPRLEQEVRKQKVRNRAMFGVAASLAIGAIVPFVLGG